MTYCLVGKNWYVLSRLDVSLLESLWRSVISFEICFYFKSKFYLTLLLNLFFAFSIKKKKSQQQQMTGFSSWKIMSSQTKTLVLSGIFPLKGLWCLTRRQDLRCAHKRQQRGHVLAAAASRLSEKLDRAFLLWSLGRLGRFLASAPSFRHARSFLWYSEWIKKELKS